MLAVDLVQYLTEALYVVIFVLALPRAIRHPRPANIEVALLFGVVALSVTIGAIEITLGLSPPVLLADVSAALVLALPYLLLRLVDEFAGVPGWIQRLTELGLALSIAALVAVREPRPLWMTELLIVYFGAVTLYVSAAFARAAGSQLRVTAIRMAVIATGSACLTMAILLAGLRAAFPQFDVPFGVLGGPFGLLSGVAFYTGFTPPGWLLEAWHVPDLTAFTGRADRLAEQSDSEGVLRELQAAAAAAAGVPGAFIGLWNEQQQVLEYAVSQEVLGPIARADSRLRIEGDMLRTPPDLLVAGQAFSSQRPLYLEDVERLDPANAQLYRGLGIKAAMAAPMVAGGERYGVLGVFSPRPELFGEDALARIQVIARQAAVVLRSRKLLLEAGSVQAQQQLMRAKEDFLSAATHDLKTPITAISGIAQLAERRVRSGRTPDAASLAHDFGQIREAAGHMASMIDEVLDVSRLQMGQPLQLSRTRVDLVGLARSVAERHQAMSNGHRIEVHAGGPVEGNWDVARLERVLDNLVGNAVKYSPAGGEVLASIAVDTNDDVLCARLTVRDHGIGIRPEDAERIFQRFERGTNAAEQGISGTGIGLAYVREVVTAHGGQISVESQEAAGAVFKVTLPIVDSAG